MNTSASTPTTEADESATWLHVAVGVIQDERGILLTKRARHVHQGGLWEFPGGKVESGEDVHDALRRELAEELGIRVLSTDPLIQIRHRYPERNVLLDVHRIRHYSGQPEGLEGQPLGWFQPSQLRDLPLPAANRPIVKALGLPCAYAITPEPAEPGAFLADLERVLQIGRAELLQFRAKALTETIWEELARETIERCHARGARVLLNATPEAAERLGADGVHLDSRRLMASSTRPLGEDFYVAASCHNAEELARAQAIDVDFAVLGPVRQTESHPGAEAMGWVAFGRLVEAVDFPVYALGGLGPEDLPAALAAGAIGVAGIRALWAERS